ncbi:MAG: hypothetical protein C5B50_09575 [Verrucomicrobia bacterium]|nr:MAG: hypothetical protein C5B50_09575 [Verrucomicrobiota bacterium]
MKTRNGNRPAASCVAFVVARLLWLCATSATLGPGTSGAATGQEPLYYHYFKERRPLKLDTERVAFRQTRTIVSAGVGQAVSRFGLAPPETRTLPIPGWSLARTPAASLTEPAARDLVSRMAGDSGFEFVAPVFVGDDGGPVIVTPDILVGFEAGVTDQQAESVLAAENAGVIVHRNLGNMKGAYHLKTRLKSGLDVLALANKLAARPEVKFAEPDMIFTGRGDLIPNDPGFSNLWGMQNTEQFGGAVGMDMKAPQAWDITTGSSNIIVVIIDVGVQTNHPDINQIQGTNFTSDASFDGGPVNACDNHGTAVAGCVSAIINNNLGTVGIAPGCRCASARAFISNLSCDGSWTTSSDWTVNALEWAQSLGARVSNNSNGYGFQSAAIAAEYLFTRGMGMVHFASAGNNATNSITYPASLPGVNAVAALNEGGGLSSFSDYGVGLAFSAPGQDIYTTDRTGASGYGTNDYVFSNGTSLASPYAAGVAALVLSVNRSLSATNVEQIMQQSAVDLGPPGYDTKYGWGMVNAYNAVVLALAHPPATITVTNTADSGPGTLRAALAGAANGDTIDASGVTGAILLTSGELLVSNNVTILGPGPANLAVNGNGASRAFNISGTAVTITGLTITNGNASGGYPANCGGGIYMGPGTLTVSNCILNGNSAQFDGGAVFANRSIMAVSACTFGSNSVSANGGGIFINAVVGNSTLNISNCTFRGNTAVGVGGGVFNNGNTGGNATVTVSASTFSGNSANGGNGGGIFNHGYSGSVNLTMSASAFSSNSSSYNGGGIFNNGYSGSATLTVSNCAFSANVARSDSGGGIYNNGQVSGKATALILNSTLSGNLAGYGAGIYNDGDSAGNGTLTVSNCILNGNRASGWGGGIFNNGTSSGTGTVQVVSSTLSSNSAANSFGGGIFNNGNGGNGVVTVSASTLSSNLASANGGGIYNDGESSGTGTVQIASSTLSGNSASGDGGGIYNDGTSAGKVTLVIKASTLSGNLAGSGIGGAIRSNGSGGSASVEIGSSILNAGASGASIANLSGAVSSDGYNLSSDSAGGLLTNTTDQINTDPMLGPLQDNGGPTFTHALLCGSPAIDQGRNFSASATDQRDVGFARTVIDPTLTKPPGGDGTDIGAFEVQQPCAAILSLANFGAGLNQFGFDIGGSSHRLIVVEASTNFVSWTALATNTLGAAPLHFTDPAWANFPQRFYRAKLAQ